MTRLVLQNFRNFENSRFDFEPGLNFVWGENGSGKSNLLESLYFAATGRPKRAVRDGDQIRFGETAAYVEARIQTLSGEAILEAAVELPDSPSGVNAKKILKLNRQPVRRLSELLGRVKVVLFTPADEAVVQGEPSVRRRFLDLALSQMSARYLHALQQYQIVREQRNSLLKVFHSQAELSPWTEKLAEFGSEVLIRRMEMIPRLSAAAAEIHRGLSDQTELSLSYQSTFSVPPGSSFEAVCAAFQKALQETAFLEKERRVTLTGPHRDDFLIALDGVDARQFGSQGEQKTAAFSLKLAEGRLFAEASGGQPPLYLLDDCFSELDPARQAAVLRIIRPEAQSILTFSSLPPEGLKPSAVTELVKTRRAGERREAVSSL